MHFNQLLHLNMETCVRKWRDSFQAMLMWLPKKCFWLKKIFKCPQVLQFRLMVHVLINHRMFSYYEVAWDDNIHDTRQIFTSCVYKMFWHIPLTSTSTTPFPKWSLKLLTVSKHGRAFPSIIICWMIGKRPVLDMSIRKLQSWSVLASACVCLRERERDAKTLQLIEAEMMHQKEFESGFLSDRLIARP